MGNIARGTKTYGTTQFATERAAAPGNKAPILSAEVDLDFNTIYQAWNDGIDITDLKPGFVIGHAQLGTDAVESNNIKNGTIKLEDMGPDSVDSSKIKDLSILAGDLAADSVITSKILDKNVTKEKLAVGASIWSAGGQRKALAYPGTDITSRTESAFLTATGISGRAPGGAFGIILNIRVAVYGMLTSADASTMQFGITLRRDGAQFQSMFRHGGGNNAPWTLYYEDYITAPDGNPHNYTVDVGSSGGYCTVQGGSIIMLASP